jgi:hypothetical protein
VGWSVNDIFDENAESLLTYGLKGLMQKVNLNLWDGFHDTLIDMVVKGD